MSCPACCLLPLSPLFLCSASKKSSKKESQGRKKRSKKDPNAPKRAMSAYILFSNDHRAQVKEEKQGLKFGDIARELASRWKTCSPGEKSVRTKHSTHTAAGCSGAEPPHPASARAACCSCLLPLSRLLPLPAVQKYEAKSAKDKSRYEKEMAAYKAKTGDSKKTKGTGKGKSSKKDDDEEEEEEEEEDDNEDEEEEEED